MFLLTGIDKDSYSATGMDATSSATQQARGETLQGRKVTPINHRCVAFRSSVEKVFVFLWRSELSSSNGCTNFNEILGSSLFESGENIKHCAYKVRFPMLNPNWYSRESLSKSGSISISFSTNFVVLLSEYGSFALGSSNPVNSSIKDMFTW